MDTDWIKAAAAQVRTTIRQAVDRVDRIGNGRSGRVRRPALDDTPNIRNHPEGKGLGTHNE